MNSMLLIADKFLFFALSNNLENLSLLLSTLKLYLKCVISLSLIELAVLLKKQKLYKENNVTFKYIYIYIYQRRPWQPTPVLLPGKSHGQRSLVGCSPWGRTKSDTSEQLHFQFSLSCIGKGNGNPLQCSCLENPRDGGAWWAVIYGVAQSQTRLK